MTAPEVVGAAAGRTDQLLDRLFGEASPDSVFSTPEPMGDDLVITAAAWERAGGFGFGGGGGGQDDGGGGGGGGGVSQGRPVAVIRLTPGGTQVTPVIDFTKLGVTVLLGVVGLWKALRS